jgi:hypothetical protein
MQPPKGAASICKKTKNQQQLKIPILAGTGWGFSFPTVI